MQFGPISRHPAWRMRFTRVASRARPASVAFTESGADHADGADLLGDAVVNGLEYLCCGHDDHREIDRSGNVDDAPVGGETFEFGRRRVHRHD